MLAQRTSRAVRARVQAARTLALPTTAIAERACKPDSVKDSHPSGTHVAVRLMRPTWACASNAPPFLALLRMGFAMRRLLPAGRCALAAPFQPCLCPKAIGGLLSAALSIALRRPAVSRHPALRSPDFPLRLAQRPPSPLDFTYRTVYPTALPIASTSPDDGKVSA